MARARNIKPSFFKNELLADMGAFDRLLFIGLWCLADREGRVEDRPKRIKMELFPCDDYDVEHGLVELERHGFVKRYVACGVRVILIVNFMKHQTPHGTEKDSQLPDEDGNITVHERMPNGCVTGSKRKNNVKKDGNNVNPQLDTSTGTVNPQGKNALNPESRILNPDSLNPEVNTAPATQAPPTKKPKPPTAIDRPADVTEQTWTDFTAMRKANRAPLTATALDGIKREADKAGLTLQDALHTCCTRGWRGFKAEWVADSKPARQNQTLSFAERDELERRKRWEEMTGRKWPTEGDASQIIDINPLEIGHESANQSH